MARRKTLGSAPALALLLIAGITIGAGASTPAYAAKKDLTDKESVQVRHEDERRLKSLDKDYAKQAKAQAKYYEKLAKDVKKAGGNAQPLLDAAAYFDSEAKKY